MAFTEDDVIRITIDGSYKGADIINVFYYLIEALVAGVLLIDLLAEFRDSVRDLITPLQHVDFSWIEIKGENVTNELDVEVLSAPADGTDSAGEPVNPFTAWAHDLIVADRTTRKGSKRFAGLSEGRMTGSFFFGADPETDELEAALAVTLSVAGTPSGSCQAIPVVVGRQPDGTLDLARVAPIVSAPVRLYVTSQVSRKTYP